MTVISTFSGMDYEIETLMHQAGEVVPTLVVVPVWVARQYREQVKSLTAQLAARDSYAVLLEGGLRASRAFAEERGHLNVVAAIDNILSQNPSPAECTTADRQPPAQAVTGEVGAGPHAGTVTVCPRCDLVGGLGLVEYSRPGFWRCAVHGELPNAELNLGSEYEISTSSAPSCVKREGCPNPVGCAKEGRCCINELRAQEQSPISNQVEDWAREAVTAYERNPLHASGKVGEALDGLRTALRDSSPRLYPQPNPTPAGGASPSSPHQSDEGLSPAAASTEASMPAGSGTAALLKEAMRYLAMEMAAGPAKQDFFARADKALEQFHAGDQS